MTLLVGLGNPGDRYRLNRHNVGFMAVETIAHRNSITPWRSKFSGSLAEGRIGSAKVRLFKPETYMNESGRAVRQAIDFFDLGVDDIIVFHDELDLAPGKVRVKTGGGLAGHNGLKSIAAHLGPDFKRVRIGIGHPGHKDAVSPWVLGDFAKSDRDWLIAMLDAIGDGAGDLVAGEDGRFMTRVAEAVRTIFPDGAPQSGLPRGPSNDE
ncbi:MAG: aminoacyl-tRNA hydrolase [Pseudomonadota bacterium]